jgi:hypothetical protein
MKKLKLLLIIGILLTSTKLFSQFTIDGEFRPRVMIDNGYKTIKLETDPTLVYISQRSRINFGYKKDKIETYFSFQDVHYWGDDDTYSSTGVSGNTKSIVLHQAWFALKPTSDIMIKIGRQQFNYDDQRILSARNWNEYQVTYDALLFVYSKEKNKLDIAATWNTNGATDAFYPKTKMKLQDFIRYERSLGKINLSAIAIFDGYTKADSLTDTKNKVTDIALTGTYGANLLYKTNGFDFRFTGYYQNELNKISGKIRAYCLSVFAKKSLFQEKASVGIGLDLLSGNNDTITDATYKNTQHKFNVFYGNRHSMLGYMDFYSSIPNQGVQDYMLKAEYKISKDLLLQGDYHWFFLANKGKLAKINKDLNLGSELDLTVQWKFMKDVTLQAGYSFYLVSDTFEKLKGANNQSTKFPQFAYLMITVKPTFFKSE